MKKRYIASITNSDDLHEKASEIEKEGGELNRIFKYTKQIVFDIENKYNGKTIKRLEEKITGIKIREDKILDFSKYSS